MSPAASAGSGSTQGASALSPQLQLSSGSGPWCGDAFANELEPVDCFFSSSTKPQQRQQQRPIVERDAPSEAEELLSAIRGSMCSVKDSRGGKKLKGIVASLTARLGETVATNRSLHDRVNSQEARIDLLNQEETWLLQRSLHLRNSPAALPAHVPGYSGSSLAVSGDGLCKRISAGEVSFASLPDTGSWDVSWEERVLSLSALDLLLLRRRWLMEVAMMLPKAQCEGPGSPEYQALVSTCDRYTGFSQRAMTLVPEQWTLSTKYNMETLEPFEVPSKEFMTSFLQKRRNTASMQAIFNESLAALRTLRAEYDALCAEHGRLATTAGGGGGSYYKPGSASEQACEASTVMDDLLCRMQSNLRRQHMVTKQSTFAVYRACRDRGCADMVQMALVMYPLPMSVIHYLDAFV